MPAIELDVQQLHDRFDKLERKFDALEHRLEQLLEKLEAGEDWPLRYMPQPGNMNDLSQSPHVE
jgi:hypothetical protein